ncbi:hypothetical protein H9L39_17775, partial [Fusarium oxysporum f. sp. albedinis]
MTTMITDSSLQMVLSGTVFVSTIYGAAIVWYRLYLHPLSQYPGPFWSWISAFQDIATLLDRIGIYEICGLTTIYNNKANVKKAVYYKVYPCNVHDMKTWNSIDKATHARKRRAMNHAFSDKALRSSGPFIHFNIDRWIELLKEEIRERQWNALLRELKSKISCKHDVNQVLRVERTFSNISSWPWSGYWKECSNEEVFIESGSLVIAGSDTSAIGLAAAFFYLTRNPHAQEKHAKESRAAFSSVGGIQGGAALHSSQYLRAFIQGTMRMSPPVPTDIAPEVQQVALLLAGDISRRARRPALCPTACITILICILSHSSFVLNGRLSMRRMSVVILLRVSI